MELFKGGTLCTSTTACVNHVFMKLKRIADLSCETKCFVKLKWYPVASWA